MKTKSTHVRRQAPILSFTICVGEWSQFKRSV